MPFFVAINPETLAVTEAYEYEAARETTHIEVKPPLDYRALNVSRDPETGEIRLTSNATEFDKFEAWEIDARRTERNELLFKSDWTQCIDAPLSDTQKAAWRVYRQQLRDFTQPFPQLPTGNQTARA
jgi:hypothetical protein